MPVKSLNNAAAVGPPRRHSLAPAPSAGGSTGIRHLQSVANTPERTTLLPTSPGALPAFGARAERQSAACASLPWEDDALLQQVMLRGETLMDRAWHQRETGFGAPPCRWRLSTKKALLLGGLLLAGAVGAGLWRAYRGPWSSAGHDNDETWRDTLGYVRHPDAAAVDRTYFLYSPTAAGGPHSPAASAALAPPHAAAYVADPPPTTTLAPTPDEVKKVKLDFSCFEQRQTLTAAGILRQIGKTLKNPVSALVEESQVIYFYQNVGRCPSEDEVEKLSNITHKVDAVVSAVVALLPGSQPLVIAQNIGGPLLKMLADEIDGLPVDVNEANEVNNQILLLAKSIIAASPKDNRGVPIDRTLTLPKNTFVSGQSLATRIEGEVWRITHRQGRFYARRRGVEREVQYDVKRGGGGWKKRIPCQSGCSGTLILAT